MSELFSTFHDFSNALCRGTILVAGSHIWCCWLLPSYGHSSWAWLQKKKFPWCCRHCFWPHMSKLLGEQMLCYWCCRLHPLLALTRYIFCIATVSYFFTAPILTVMDGFGRELLDQFYKVGSSLEVMCQVDRLPARPLPDIIEWRHGNDKLPKSNATSGQRCVLSLCSIHAVAWKCMKANHWDDETQVIQLFS